VPRPRKTLVAIEDTPYYHVVSRCVRRAFLCGVDRITGQNYEHRRRWVEERIRLLSSIFSIDICAYAVMSNHLHIVVKLNTDEQDSWSNEEVLSRWASLFKGPLLLQKAVTQQPLTTFEKRRLLELTSEYRARLGSLSWFMKCLNEPIARRANKEDDCTGHFWEGRFKSQALRSQKAVLSCMAYVDLNPIRSGLATTPEQSEYTSIKERIHPRFNERDTRHIAVKFHGLQAFDVPLKPLAALTSCGNQCSQESITCTLTDYLKLVDFTGRQLHPRKHGAIALSQPHIFERLNIDQEQWLKTASQFEKLYRKRLIM